MNNERLERLKEAVWQSWLRGVRGAMGGAGTPREVLREYGFTGEFAGLDNFYSKSEMYEIQAVLEDEFGTYRPKNLTK